MKFDKNSYISSLINIHKRIFISFIPALWLALLPLSSSAAVVSFTPSLIAGNHWRYDYTVSATPSDPSIDEFTIYFDPALYRNLVNSASPLGWDSIVIEPDAVIPADGFLDALALIGSISPGANQGGFAVSFDFLGIGAPGVQRFDIVDPNTFQTLSTGLTSAVKTPPVSEVPEPATLTLIGLGLALSSLLRRHASIQI